MAHFARLDENNIVTEIVIVDNKELLDDEGAEQESLGIAFLVNLFGHTNWKQTSYNKKFRKRYAGPGFTYDESRDAFLCQKPFPSWTLDEDTCKWKPPVTQPTNDKKHSWNEITKAWDEVESLG